MLIFTGHLNLDPKVHISTHKDSDESDLAQLQA